MYSIKYELIYKHRVLKKGVIKWKKVRLERKMMKDIKRCFSKSL